MSTAGRAVVFSGTAVAIGLALLLFMPLTFLRGFGLGRPLHPDGLGPRGTHASSRSLLSLFGRAARRRTAPAGELARASAPTTSGVLAVARAQDHEAREAWSRPAPPDSSSCSRRRILALELGPGGNDGLPRGLEAVDGYDVLAYAVGAGAMAPRTSSCRHGQGGRRRRPGRPRGRRRAPTSARGRPRGRRHPLRRDAPARRRDRSLPERRGRSAARLREAREPRVRRAAS